MKKDLANKEIAKVVFGKPESTDRLLEVLGWIKVKGGYVKEK